VEGSGSASSIRVVPASGPAVPGVGKYRYIATLEEGGMADVFLAVTKDSRFEKIVVIKQLRDALAEDPSFVAMFMDEARLAARLNHPNVVQTLEVGTDLGIHFLAMEFLEGVSYVRMARLRDRIPAPLALHVRVLVETLRGLHYAHELRDYDGRPLGVVHRDVSPQNVMITFDGVVKVLDFGIAKAALAVERRPEDFKGKLEYMAPEQALVEDVDRRADIFSVGVMLWEALARRRFYASGEDKYQRLTEQPAPNVRDVVPGTPKQLARICMRALARDRTERYAKAQDMADELEEWLGGTGQHVSARDVGHFVAEKFEERRARLANAIGAQLERFRSLGEQQTMDVDFRRLLGGPTDPPPPYGSGAPPAMTMPMIPSATPPPYAGGTVPLMPATTGAPPPPKSGMSGSTAMIIVTALLGLSLLATGVVVSTRTTRTRPAEAAVAGGSAASSVAPKKADEPEIDFTVKAFPANAVISVDGEPTPTNPLVGRQRRDGAIHVIRVEAPGYEPREELVTFDRSFLVTVELKASAPAPSAKGGVRRWKAAPRGATGKSGAPSGTLDTENPYQ
jgi:eukaryotic-like serine/threonine-protein kinase